MYFLTTSIACRPKYSWGIYSSNNIDFANLWDDSVFFVFLKVCIISKVIEDCEAFDKAGSFMSVL